MRTGLWIAVFAVIFCITIPAAVHADGKLREALRERLQKKAEEGDSSFTEEGGGTCVDHYAKVERIIKAAGDKAFGLPPDVSDVAYGDHAREKFDVYLPQNSAGAAPIILMVHGGGWCVGDKRLKSTVANKAARWAPRGFVVISTNYPMLTHGRNAIQQAEEIAKAAAYIQQNAAKWGGDASRMILMGHSAGAHLVSLVGADADIRAAAGMQDPLGVVSIDAGATDVVIQMPKVVPQLKTRYNEAFGTDPAGWPAASPRHQLDARSVPWLGICSITRPDKPCEQSELYVQKSIGLGITAKALPLPKGHGRLNSELGMSGSYTDSVEKFMSALDPVVASRLR